MAFLKFCSINVERVHLYLVNNTFCPVQGVAVGRGGVRGFYKKRDVEDCLFQFSNV